MREIRLTRGFVALVDDEDYERVLAAGPWCAAPNGRTVYAQRAGRNTAGRPSTQGMHAFLTGWPRTDHVNGDGLDNRRGNLRPATHAQNMQNRRTPRHSTTGFRGVTPRRDGRRFMAQIQSKAAPRRYLGDFPTPEAAARAYDAAALALYGEFASLNFPQESSA